MTLLEAINLFLELKINSGLKYKTETKMLLGLHKYVTSNNIEELTNEDILNFLLTGKNTYDQRKYYVLKLFFKWACDIGYFNTSPLKSRLKFTSDFRPYIYSKNEIHLLLTATSTLKSKQSVLQADMFKMLFLTIYNCGLRVSEARKLCCNDVDFENNTFIIRESKFLKSRYTPFHTEFRAVLLEYFNLRCTKVAMPLGDKSSLFPTRTGNTVALERIEKTFVKLRRLINFEAIDGTLPRIHDLRHTFATHSLLEAYQRHEDVQDFFRKLSIYLGHSSICETQKYISMIPELLTETVTRFEDYMIMERTNHEK